MEGRDQGDAEFLQEIAISSSCRHPSILPLLGFCIEMFVIFLIDVSSSEVTLSSILLK